MLFYYHYFKIENFAFFNSKILQLNKVKILVLKQWNLKSVLIGSDITRIGNFHVFSTK